MYVYACVCVRERETVFIINFIFLSREIGGPDLAAMDRKLLIFLICFLQIKFFLIFSDSLFLLSDRAVLSVSILTLVG